MGRGPLLVAPRVLGEPVLRAIRIAEHVGADETPDLLANTRTTLAGPAIRLLYWNMPFHASPSVEPSGTPVNSYQRAL